MTVLKFSARKDGTAVTVSITGELDIATRPAFETYLGKILSAEPSLIIMDLSGLSFIDANGLGALVSLHSRARHRQISLLLTGVPARILRLIEVAGLNNHIPVSP
jgi:anti-sigma B factor antagonist